MQAAECREAALISRASSIAALITSYDDVGTSCWSPPRLRDPLRRGLIGSKSILIDDSRVREKEQDMAAKGFVRLVLLGWIFCLAFRSCVKTMRCDLSEEKI